MFAGHSARTQAIGHSSWVGREAKGVATTHHIGRANTRFGAVLAAAVVLGLTLTYLLTIHPTVTSAQVPSPATPVQAAWIRPMPSSVPDASAPVIAVSPAMASDEVPTSRPSTAPRAEAARVAVATPVAAATPTSLVALAPLWIDVWNAEDRYFSISGTTPDELVASAVGNVPADPSGTARSTMAYVGPISWDHRPSYVQDPATGSCTMTAVASTVAYQATLPQWTAPSDVRPELLAWWHLVLEHIREHESEHVRIFDGFVRALPDRVVGQPCAAWDGIIGQWTAEVTAAHAAFDSAESHWALPAYAPGG